jgi:hypothetical protein
VTADVGIWVAALTTIAIYTFLWQENRLFRFVEHLYVGVAAGYGIVFAYRAIVRQAWEPLTTKGRWEWVIPIVLGLILYTRFFRRVHWLSRWPLAFLMGLGAALSMKAIESDLVRQVQATLVKLNTLDNILLVFGTVSVLMYFFFTVKDNPAVRAGSTLGRITLMMCFGAAFGNAVMGRISLLIARLQFLFTDWVYLIR